MTRRSAVLVALALVAAAAPAPAMAPPPCPGVRFLVDEVVVPGTALPFDAIVIDAGGNATIARVIARALQRYGMILADGGNIALTAQSDRFTAHTWSAVGVDTRALQAIQVTDMEVVGMGTPITLTYDCARNP